MFIQHASFRHTSAHTTSTPTTTAAVPMAAVRPPVSHSRNGFSRDLARSHCVPIHWHCIIFSTRWDHFLIMLASPTQPESQFFFLRVLSPAVDCIQSYDVQFIWRLRRKIIGIVPCCVRQLCTLICTHIVFISLVSGLFFFCVLAHIVSCVLY